MSSNSNIEIEKRFENGNAYMISGIQIASGAPMDGQILVYSAANKQWEYFSLAGPTQAAPPDGQ